MTDVTPFLWFDGDAEEAVRYYVSVLADSQITGLSHYGPGMPYPEGSVMTVTFTLAGRPFTALLSDPNPLRSAAAAQAMVSMSKLDIAAMRAAADAAEAAPAETPAGS